MITETLPMNSEDCDVIDRAMLELGSKLRFEKPWLVQFSDGKVEQFDTMTGEPVRN